MNGVVAVLALMGIAVAASELPLAFRKRETLLGKRAPKTLIPWISFLI